MDLKHNRGSRGSEIKRKKNKKGPTRQCGIPTQWWPDAKCNVFGYHPYLPPAPYQHLHNISRVANLKDDVGRIGPPWEENVALVVGRGESPRTQEGGKEVRVQEGLSPTSCAGWIVVCVCGGIPQHPLEETSGADISLRSVPTPRPRSSISSK
ncbi:hypothetical protein CEXT_287911 [Caerostris extrusa]|uniref:Uncharacterized protein n=1 Tax=Caerostris extrusa TaxID=172846 RepID=A0AAV4UYM1_CAEEX|nr:hypothetical protein CEXT_287911 [Caerostris extrusa]